MAEELNSETEVILEIENSAIKCNKQELMRHSDYFKVMFEGSFVECNQKVVKLEGVDLNAMNIILTMLWDKDLVIEREEDVRSVLEASSMLQFVDIKTTCIERLTKVLSPHNCIKTWLLAEQLDIKPLYLKAKNMALIEFSVIKDSESILELDLNQLQNYLANTSLQCDSELDVFEVCMKWWYENSEKLVELMSIDRLESFRTETFLYLLSCINFKSLRNSEIQEIISYPDLSQNSEVVKILYCIIKMKDNTAVDYDEYIISKAKIFCNSKSRSYKRLPCILVNRIDDEHISKKQKVSSNCNENRISVDKSVVFYDMLRRYYTNVEPSEPSTTVICYGKYLIKHLRNCYKKLFASKTDERKHNFIKFLSIGLQKCSNLGGFQIIGYKELIFFFGGGYVIGEGFWNTNFWVYDTIKEAWERKSVMPFVRRHFQSCVCGNYLFIIGGTGKYRVIQDNMFWYNYKEDQWSLQMNLPCSGMQIKCFCWNEQLIILNLNEKCGYLHMGYTFCDQQSQSWCKMNICDEEQLVSHFPDEYAVFSYKDSIYIKGNCIIEMKVKDQKLIVVKFKPLESVDYDEIESIVCGDTIYTLYRQTCPDKENISNTLSLEKYDIESQTSEFILKDVSEETVINLGGDEYAFKMSTVFFAFQHHNLVISDNFVNNVGLLNV